MSIRERSIIDDLRVEGAPAPPRVIDLRDIELPEETPADRSDATTPQRTPIETFRQLALALAAIDVVCLVTALIAAHTLRFGWTPDSVIQLALASCVWVGIFYFSGLYAPQRLSFVEEVRRTVAAVGLGIVLIISLTFWTELYLSRSWMALTIAIALPLELVARRIVRTHVVRLQESGALALKTLVIGSGAEAIRLMDELDGPGSGFIPVGQIDPSHHLLNDPTVSQAKRVGRLRVAIREFQPDCIFIASPTIPEGEMITVTTAARMENAEVRINTHLSNVLTSRLSIQQRPNSTMSLTIRPIRLSPSASFVKRSMDLAIALAATLLALPAMAVIAIAVRLTSPGPAIFRQDRVTEGGRHFPMYKFRTMRCDAGKVEEQHQMDKSVAFFKIKDDPRLTPLGKVLRKLSLDELPQLFNVIRGDMSLVGPRPLPADQVSANLDLLGPRHEVRAGCTGWWQIRGRSEIEADQAVNLDLFYIENWSPALDMYILFKTVGVLLSRKGAY